MGYYLAPSLGQLRAEVDARWPGRDTASDGWIGDAAHTYGDHLPDPDTGVVRALDIDASDIDAMAVVRALIADPRTEYVIHAGRIWLRSSGFRARVYTGANPHRTHIHLSLRHTLSAENSTAKWLPEQEDDDMTQEQYKALMDQHRVTRGELNKIGGKILALTRVVVANVATDDAEKAEILAAIEREGDELAAALAEHTHPENGA